MGRNPRTGEAVPVADKVVPHFKTGKEMRQRLNVRPLTPPCTGDYPKLSVISMAFSGFSRYSRLLLNPENRILTWPKFGASLLKYWQSRRLQPQTFDVGSRCAMESTIRETMQGARFSSSAYFFFLSGRCESAEPAAVLEFLPVRSSRRTLISRFTCFAACLLIFRHLQSLTKKFAMRKI